MYSFYCTNLPMAMDVLAEMMDRPDLTEFFAVRNFLQEKLDLKKKIKLKRKINKKSYFIFFRNIKNYLDIHCRFPLIY